MWRTFYTTDPATCLRTYRRVWVVGRLPRLASTVAAACVALGAAALPRGLERYEAISGPPAAFIPAPGIPTPGNPQRASSDALRPDLTHASAGEASPLARMEDLPRLPAFLPLAPGSDETTAGRTVPGRPEQPVTVRAPPSLPVLLLSALLAVLVRQKRR